MVKSLAKLQTETAKRSARKVNGLGEGVIRIVEHTVEDAYERTSVEAIEFHRMLFEITYANLRAYFQFLREAASVNSPLELETVYIRHSQRQLETYRKQAAELFGLAQKAAVENMGPLGQSIGNALTGNVEFA